MKRLGVLLALLLFVSALGSASALTYNGGSIQLSPYDAYIRSGMLGISVNEAFQYFSLNASAVTPDTYVYAGIHITTASGEYELVLAFASDRLDVYKAVGTTASDRTVIYSTSYTQSTPILYEFKRNESTGQYDFFVNGARVTSLTLDFGNITEIFFGTAGGSNFAQGSDSFTVASDDNAKYVTVYSFVAGEEMHYITFSLKDALTGQALTGVTVKENGQVLGTLDDGGTLELAKGTHALTFEKSGYWSVTKTIDVRSDMRVSVEMYPDSAAFRLENFPAEIKIPENTIYTLTFTLSPIQTSATYNTYLSVSGLSDVIEVRKDGSAISPESGKYYLGDISSPVQVSIKFKAGAVGQHGFTISIESHDAIMSKTYTTTKTVTYTVEPLPFSVQMPSEWQVGQNELRISESSGQSYLITAVLKDSQGNEVWSDSHAFSPYEAHTFTVNVPSEGSYTLELQFQGKTAVYDITVNPAITLVTKTLTVQKGGEGTIVLHFKNPSSSVQYYTIKVSGGFLPAEINQSISVAPLTEKDVSIAFAVPDKLTYDAYELNVAVYQGDSVVFQDKVAVSISDSGGFSLLGGGGGTSTWVYVLLGLLVVGGLVWALRRRR